MSATEQMRAMLDQLMGTSRAGGKLILGPEKRLALVVPVGMLALRASTRTDSDRVLA